MQNHFHFYWILFSSFDLKTKLNGQDQECKWSRPRPRPRPSWPRPRPQKNCLKTGFKIKTGLKAFITGTGIAACANLPITFAHDDVIDKLMASISESDLKDDFSILILVINYNKGRYI